MINSQFSYGSLQFIQLLILESKNMSESNNRIYYGLLQRVGNMNNYQKNVFKILFVFSVLGASTFFVNTYLFYQDPYICGTDINNCQKMVCSLPPSQRSQYLPEKTMTTLGNFNGDNHCQNMKDVTTMQQSMLLGASFGLFLGVASTDFLGRRITIIVSVLSSIVGLLVILIIPNITVKCAGMILWGSGAQISFTVLYSYLTEIVEEKQRPKYYTYLTIGFSIGTTANSVIFYILKDWILALSLYYALFYTIGLVAFYQYVESPPIEIISKSRNPDQAFKAFMRIASHNDKHDHGITLEQIQDIYLEYHQNQKTKHQSETFTFIDVLRYPSLKLDFAKLSLIFFFLMFLLYCPQLLLDKLSSNIFIDGFLNGITQFATIPLLFQINASLSRSRGLMMMFAGTSLATFVQFFFNKADCINCAKGLESIIIFIFFIFGRFMINLCSNFFCNTLNQTFPAQIRGICVFSVVGVGRFSTLLIPFMPKIKQHLGLSYNLIFTFVGLLAVLASYFIKQTLNTLPPEMIQQLRFQQHDAQDRLKRKLLIKLQDW